MAVIYRVLLEDKVLMSEPLDQSPAQLIPIRVETLTLNNENHHPRLSRSQSKVRDGGRKKERKQERENNTVISGHYACHAAKFVFGNLIF
jgi:hypothetical protein